MSTKTLRPYQASAIRALERGYSGGERRLGISLPTGTGKTFIMGNLAHRHQRRRVLVLVHRDELLDQTVATLRGIDRQMSVGAVKAAKNQGGADVVVASIQTVSRPERLAQLGFFGLVIADEAHRSMATQWTNVFWALGCTDSDRYLPDPEWLTRLPQQYLDVRRQMIHAGVFAAGFSATWCRSDKLELGDFWQRIVFRVSTAWAIRKGYLVMPTGKQLLVDMDLEGIKKGSDGDYSDKALGAIIADDSIAEAIVRGYLTFTPGEPGVLFAPTVASSEFFAEAMRANGITAEGVYGETPKRERSKIYQDSRDGKLNIITSCGVLAEGFDAPHMRVGVLARPTRHPGLFIQQVGRVLRPSPETGKTGAFILDVVGASEEHKIDWWAELAQTDPPEPLEDPTEDDVVEGESGGFGLLDKPDKPRAKFLGFEDVELYGNQRAYWHRTANGVMFVDCDRTLIFVEPQPDSNPNGDHEGHWRIGECPKRTMAGGSWLSEYIDGSADAMDYAGEIAIGKNSTTAARNASWRAKARHRAPTPQQLGYASSLGIDVGSRQFSAEEISDAITYVIASRVLSQVRYPQPIEVTA